MSRHTSIQLSTYFALLLGALHPALSVPHGGEAESAAMAHGSMDMNVSASVEWSESFSKPSYFHHPNYVFWIYAHIISMVLAWAVALPIVVMFSIARSRYSLLLQIAFFALNGLGLSFGIVYNANTPDLYENNSHHPMGWAFTWLSLAWICLSVVKSYARGSSGHVIFGKHSPLYERLPEAEDFAETRWSGDTTIRSERRDSAVPESGTPTSDHTAVNFNDGLSPYAKAPTTENDGRPRLLLNTRFDRFLSQHLQRVGKSKAGLLLRVAHGLLERTLVIQAFAVMLTGIVAYGGIFRGSEVFTGLAHFIKGGIFFWIGILTVGRWAGAFADLGWAWNVKPPGRSNVPSAEFFESLLICIYGASNVWLEHLTAWGEAWSAMDYEHVSITILFFGAGLLGMLIESRAVRTLLNTSWTPPLRRRDSNPKHELSPESTTAMNPVPALTIFLLGLIMAAHQQHSALAGTMHTYWGALFACGALARLGTYLLHYLSPPASHTPARPPTEMVAGFALVAGGVLFMMSARDITDVIEGSGGDAMVAFTVGAGVTAVVCAGAVGCMALKGWALRRELVG